MNFFYDNICSRRYGVQQESTTLPLSSPLMVTTRRRWPLQPTWQETTLLLEALVFWFNCTYNFFLRLYVFLLLQACLWCSIVFRILVISIVHKSRLTRLGCAAKYISSPVYVWSLEKLFGGASDSLLPKVEKILHNFNQSSNFCTPNS